MMIYPFFAGFLVGFLLGLLTPYVLKTYENIVATIFMYLVTVWSKIELKLIKVVKVLKDEAKKYPFVWKMYLYFVRYRNKCGFTFIKNDKKLCFVPFDKEFVDIDVENYDYVIGKFLNETNETVYNVIAENVTDCIKYSPFNPTSFQFMMIEIIYQTQEEGHKEDPKEDEDAEEEHEKTNEVSPLSVSLKGPDYNYMIVGNKITKSFFKYFLSTHYREKYLHVFDFKVRILDGNFNSFELIDPMYLLKRDYLIDVGPPFKFSFEDGFEDYKDDDELVNENNDDTEEKEKDKEEKADNNRKLSGEESRKEKIE